MKKVTILLLLSLSFTMTAFSTPNEAIWENETLMGINDQSFYTIKTCKYLTSSYYYNIDSVFLIEREISTGKVTEKIVLRVIEHEDATTDGDWKHTEMIENPINVMEYQKKKKIELVFQSNYEDTKFKFTKEGLALIYDDSEEPIENKDQIVKFVDWFDEYITEQEKYPNEFFSQIRISQTYESSTHIFFVVEGGADHTDTDFRQTVLAIDYDKYNTAKQKINERKN